MGSQGSAGIEASSIQLIAGELAGQQKSTQVRGTWKVRGAQAGGVIAVGSEADLMAVLSCRRER